MKIIILGAGASKSYEDSKAKLKMPIANDFFATFHNLKISENPWVLIGWILNYLKTFHNVEFINFLNYNTDIEVLHSEIQEKLTLALSRSENYEPNDIVVISAYTQLLFLFTSVINEIQNGPVSETHLRISKCLNDEDIIITFNWDTLMDRALNVGTSWKPETGYFVTPALIFRNGWQKNKTTESATSPLLLKLHGSTNWLTSYMVAEDGQMNLIQESKPDEFYCYESNNTPYSCFQGRYMSGYEDYSYGYYPPNLPINGKSLPEGYFLTRLNPNFENVPKGITEDKGLDSMPLIIPPVKHKEYDFFGGLFKNLWEKAEESLTKADEIYIIGYSFPVTDIQTDTLLKKAFIKRSTIPKIFIVNPYPNAIVERFQYDYGIPENAIRVYKEYFSKDFDVEKLFGH